MKKHTIGLKIGAAALGLMAVAAVPAQASVKVYQGDDWGTYNATSKRVWIHDMECDSNGAYAKWHFEGVSDDFKIRWDDNGCDSGGSYVDLSGDYPAGSNGIWLRVCENDDSPVNPWDSDSCSDKVYFRK